MVFKREFLTNIKSLLIWSISLFSLIILLLSIYPQFAAEQQSLQELLEVYPESLKNAFGMNNLDMGSLIGYYGIQVYMMLTLLGSIYAAILAGSIVAKEENDHTIEFLLSKPISRQEVITQKLLLVGCNIVILNIFSIVASIIGFQFSEQAIEVDTYILLATAVLLLHLTFGSICFMLSSLMKKTRKIISLSLGIVIGTYFLSVAIGISDKLDFLKYVTPFEYVNSSEIITMNQIKSVSLFLMISIIFVSSIASHFIYTKKDLSS